MFMIVDQKLYTHNHTALPQTIANITIHKWTTTIPHDKLTIPFTGS